MQWRFATIDDSRVLAELNQQLIEDEEHRNSMNIDQLEQRMRLWLGSEYRAVVFLRGSTIVAYALYRGRADGDVHLRQFFVARDSRRQGVGREAMRTFRNAVLDRDKRIVLEVLTNNAAARAFWNATGFREYAVTLECLPVDEASK